LRTGLHYRRFVCAFFIALIILLAFALVIDDTFVRDDFLWLGIAQDSGTSPFIKILSTIKGREYRPIVTGYFVLMYGLFGASPVFFHLTSILVHIATSLLLYTIALKWLRDPPLSIALSLLFGLRASAVQAVLWIGAIGTLVCGLFYVVASLAFYLYTRTDASRYYLLSFVTFVVALLAKEEGMTVPIVLALIALFFSDRRGKHLLTLVPMFFLTAIVSLYRLLYQKEVLAKGLAATAGAWGLVLNMVRSLVNTVFPLEKTTLYAITNQPG